MAHLAAFFTLVECPLLPLRQAAALDLAHPIVVVVHEGAPGRLAANHGEGGRNGKGEVETFSEGSGGSGEPSAGAPGRRELARLDGGVSELGRAERRSVLDGNGQGRLLSNPSVRSCSRRQGSFGVPGRARRSCEYRVSRSFRANRKNYGMGNSRVVRRGIRVMR